MHLNSMCCWEVIRPRRSCNVNILLLIHNNGCRLIDQASADESEVKESGAIGTEFCYKSIFLPLSIFLESIGGDWHVGRHGLAGDVDIPLPVCGYGSDEVASSATKKRCVRNDGIDDQRTVYLVFTDLYPYTTRTLNFIASLNLKMTTSNDLISDRGF